MKPNAYTREGAALLLGEKGERAVAEVLAGKFFDVLEVGGQSFDLLLNDRVTVEVKTALPTPGSNGNKKRWQFMLHKRGRGRPLEEHILILRCQAGIGKGDKAWHYVIPGFLRGLGELTKIDITGPPGKYKGKWTLFYETWRVVDAVVALAEREQWPGPQEKEMPF